MSARFNNSARTRRHARDGLSAGPQRPAAPVPPSGQDKSAQTAQQLRTHRSWRLEAVQHERIGTECRAEPVQRQPLPVRWSRRERTRVDGFNNRACGRRRSARIGAPPAAPSPAHHRNRSRLRSGPSRAVATAETAAPTWPAVTVAPGSPARAFGAGTGGGRGVAVPVEIRSPESRYRWRIIPPAGIQRSTDDGVTWAVVDPIELASSAGNRSSITLAAGSAPARDICWIVGRGGMVLLTLTVRWTRRPFQKPASQSCRRAHRREVCHAAVGSQPPRRSYVLCEMNSFQFPASLAAAAAASRQPQIHPNRSPCSAMGDSTRSCGDTVWWLFPVLSSLSTVSPLARPTTSRSSGTSGGWATCWSTRDHFFFTPFHFMTGVDLTRHSHALPALLGALANGSPGPARTRHSLHLFELRLQLCARFSHNNRVSWCRCRHLWHLVI